jgi:hypothetical protein
MPLMFAAYHDMDIALTLLNTGAGPEHQLDQSDQAHRHGLCPPRLAASTLRIFYRLGHLDFVFQSGSCAAGFLPRPENER